MVRQSTVDENKAWDTFRRRIHPAPSRPVRKFGWLRMAAAWILLAGIAAVIYWVLNPGSTAAEQIVSATTEVMNDTLSDGSVVTLNKASTISYPARFRGDKRVVKLKGEAFFAVTPDKKKPFVIDLDSVQVTVVGTSFNVKHEPGLTEVIVETGIVRVSSKEGTVELKPGEKISFGPGSEPVKQEVTDQLYNYYRTREFVCDDTPLWKLIDVLNEAYDTKIVFGNEALRDLRLNAPFNNESLDQVLQVISLTFNITVTKKDGVIILE